jgi:hypothetical protein
MDDQTIAEMVKRKTYYVPTIDHNQYYVENADSVYHFPPGAKERLLDYIRRNFETAKKAFQGGVRMVVGSDGVGGVKPQGVPLSRPMAVGRVGGRLLR